MNGVINMPKFYLYDSDIERFTACIHEDILIGGEPYTHIMGVSRGGLPVAVRLSHLLNLPMAMTNYSSPDGNGHGSDKFFWLDDRHVLIDKNSRILVVDDIADTGFTLRDIKEELDVRCDVVHFATVVYRQGSVVVPHYIGIEIAESDPWVSFPWESE